MSPDEYQELAEFVGASLERLSRRFHEQLVEQAEEIRRFVDVRIEAVQGEIRVVAEGVAANGVRIEENGRRIEENGRRIEALAVRFDAVERRIDEHDERLSRLE